MDPYEYWLNEVKNDCPIRRVPKWLISDEICMAAAEGGQSLKNIPERFRSYEICKVSVIWDKGNLPYVPQEYLCYGLYMAMVAEDGTALDAVPDDVIDEDMCLAAVERDASAIRVVPERFRGVCERTVGA